jgi:hypothetical protein
MNTHWGEELIIPLPNENLFMDSDPRILHQVRKAALIHQVQIP